MCGRYILNHPVQIAERFGVAPLDQLPLPNLNIAPTTVEPVVAVDQVQMMRWGLVPFWWKKPLVDMKLSTFNARAEGLTTSRFFNGPLHNRRCIVPADAFYEWQKVYRDGADPATAKPIKRIPYEIGLKSGEMFGFAGLYDVWTSSDGEELTTYTVITVNANEVMQPIHNRMPAILEKADEELWLNPDETEPERVLLLLKPYPADLMLAVMTQRDLSTRHAPKLDSA